MATVGKLQMARKQQEMVEKYRAGLRTLTDSELEQEMEWAKWKHGDLTSDKARVARKMMYNREVIAEMQRRAA